MGAVLLGYAARRPSLNTVSKILNVYAPPADNNDTSAYAASVCAKLGVQPGDIVDVRDPKVMDALAVAICRVEAGAGAWWKDEDRKAGLARALGAVGGSAATSATKPENLANLSTAAHPSPAATPVARTPEEMVTDKLNDQQAAKARG